MGGTENLLSENGVFVVISAFKLRSGCQPALAASAQTSAEIESLVAKSRDRLCLQMYLTRGLHASCDYFLRVHAHDLAEAQAFLARYANTMLGRQSDVYETLVGLTKQRQYITAEKSPALDGELAARPYRGDAPRFAIVVPVRKSADWWNMPEDKRREHIAVHTRESLPYLSSVKRKLYHATGLGDLDFITYFETADLKAFHELAIALAGIEENRFHSRYGSPLILGTIHEIPAVVQLLSS